jgi:hypothetical protein
MRRLLIAAVLVAGPALSADLVYRNRTHSLRLLEARCVFPSLEQTLDAEGSMVEAKAAVVRNGRLVIPACWGKDGDGDVLVADMSGTSGFLPIEWFKREP